MESKSITAAEQPLGGAEGGVDTLVAPKADGATANTAADKKAGNAEQEAASTASVAVP